MALGNYDRILFIDGSDTIYNDTGEKTTLFSYLTTNEFNGIYLFQAQNYITNPSNFSTFSSFMSQADSNGIGIRGIAYGDNSLISSINSYNSTSGSTSAKRINRFDLYNDYWGSGDTWNDWIGQLSVITSSLNSNTSLDYYIGYFQDSGSIRLPLGEVESATQQLQNSARILFSVFDKGIPIYPNVNNALSVNIQKRLDIIAEAASKLGQEANLYFFIHAGEIDWGSDGDFSGYSLRYAGSYDLFETKIIKSIVNRMTSFQKRWININGFAYYNKTHCYQALSTGSVTPPPVTGSNDQTYRVLKQNDITNWLGDTAQENTRLIYYQNHGINWIQFYGLNGLNWTNWNTGSGVGVYATAGRLKYFIQKARDQYGILRVGGIRSANISKFAEMFTYNADSHITTASQQFNDFNLENEFWFWPFVGSHPESRPFEDSVTALAYIRNQIDNVYSKTGEWVISQYTQNYKTPTSGQVSAWGLPYVTASILVQYVDVYEGTNYVAGAPLSIMLTASGSGRQGQNNQINYIASAAFDAGVTMSFVPIFSAEPNFSGPYIQSNGLLATEAQWTASWIADTTFPHKQNVKHVGYNYFVYSYLSSYVP